MEQHLEEKAAELREAGWNVADARMEARRRFGNFAATQEEARQIWIARWWRDFWQDVRQGSRALVTQPGFNAAAVVALTLGIGLNSILFNVYNALVLAPWAIRDAKETVQVFARQGNGRSNGLSWAHFRYLRDGTRAMTGLAAATNVVIRVNQGGQVWNTEALAASGNYFDLIGTGFAAGWGFSPEADRVPDAAAETILGYDTWMSRFGGDRTIVGTWLELSGHPFRVVGVAAQGFNGALARTTGLWIPAGWRDIIDPSAKMLDDPKACCTQVIGRLQAGVSPTAAQAELNVLSAQFATASRLPPIYTLFTPPTLLANPSKASNSSATFLVMGVAALLILLLACANVANLQLARAVARRREIAVRLSLGAGRGRIVRQLLAETLPMSGMAAIASTAISAWAPGAIIHALLPPGESISIRFDNDARVLAFILLATLAAALLFGLAPALAAVREGSDHGMRDGGRATTAGRLRGVLLATQVSLCTILLAGTAMIVRSLEQVRHLDPGFRYQNALVLTTGLDASGVDNDRARTLLASLDVAGVPEGSRRGNARRRARGPGR